MNIQSLIIILMMSLELNSQPPAAPAISSCLNYKCPDKEAKRELN
jgi:hypothetical protein